MNRKVAGSIPSQTTWLACGPSPQMGACEKQLIDVSLSYQFYFPSLSPSLPLFLIINKVEEVSGTSIKDTWTKPKRGRDHGWEVGMAGVGSSSGEKKETTVLEQQYKKF